MTPPDQKRDTPHAQIVNGDGEPIEEGERARAQKAHQSNGDGQPDYPVDDPDKVNNRTNENGRGDAALPPQ
jgi:hypothetical protein